ncbi:hypothetical protein CCACVL1_27305, partial [Corchorus capsularis]
MANNNDGITSLVVDPATATKTSQSSNNTVAPLLIPMAVSYAQPFLDISKIEVFDGNNFKRWMERIFS